MGSQQPSNKGFEQLACRYGGARPGFSGGVAGSCEQVYGLLRSDRKWTRFPGGRRRRRATCQGVVPGTSGSSVRLEEMEKKGAPAMIDSRVASGLRDILPPVMIPRERMLAGFRATFASFGYVPIE